MTTGGHTTQYTQKNPKCANMSANGQQRSRRQRERPLPLPVFNFPSSAPTSTQSAPPHAKHPDYFTALPPSYILDLFPTAAQGPEPQPRRRHRRNHAVSSSTSTKRYGMLPLPPVPEIPSIYKLDRATTFSRLQQSGRSMSDVSSCPTLETDSGLDSPEPFSPGDAGFDDYFSFSPVPALTDAEIERWALESDSASTTPAISGVTEPIQHDTEVATEELDDGDVDEDEDDDDEFWHCRGITESAFTTRKPSLVDDEETTDDLGVVVSAWAESVEDYFTSAVWQESCMGEGGSNDDSDVYMDLMRNPLLA